jgi:hydrogenase maturation protease
MNIILAIGSPFGADHIGWQVAEQLQRLGISHVHICQHPIDLLSYFTADAQCSIVDAMWAPTLADCEVRALKPSELARKQCSSAHGLSLDYTLRLAEQLGKSPENIQILGINISHRNGRDCTEAEATHLAEQCRDLLLT